MLHLKLHHPIARNTPLAGITTVSGLTVGRDAQYTSAPQGGRGIAPRQAVEGSRPDRATVRLPGQSLLIPSDSGRGALSVL